VFEALVDGQYANPVIVVDEIDKASCDAQYDPLGALYSLLEHDTAQSFTDEFAEVAIDASQVIWITTANDERHPEPILNRMNVFEIEPPSPEAARQIARNLYRHRAVNTAGANASRRNRMTMCWISWRTGTARNAPGLMTGFGNARLDRRDDVLNQHLPRPAQRSGSCKKGQIRAFCSEFPLPFGAQHSVWVGRLAA
jgi:ATP-dependent Lon protease